MIRDGILNPGLLSLLARVRHTNRLVIADRGFPYWPEVETIDLSLVDGIPTVLQVARAVLRNFDATGAWMAEEFRHENSEELVSEFANALRPARITFEAHVEFKRRVPGAIGLIRTGDTTQYANLILESGRPDP